MNNYAHLSNYTSGNTDKIPDNLVIDKELSNRNRTAFFDKEKNKLYYNFHPTNIKKLADIGTDVLLATGLKQVSDRFKNANKFTKIANQKYGKENVVLTGHSLGGSLSLYANSKNGNETHATSPHVPFSDVVNFNNLVHGLFKKKPNNNANIYFHKKDPISYFVPLYNKANKSVVKGKKNVSNPHAITHFL